MTSTVPGELWRDATLVDHARGLAENRLAALPTRLAHVQAVATLADRVARQLAPTALYPIVAAAYLHDIGYSAELAHTGFHPVDGAVFARSEGFPEVVVGLVAYHSGAWYEAIERGLVEDLQRFRIPPAPLLDILTYADLRTGPHGELVSAHARLAEVLDRYRPGEAVHRAVLRSRPALLTSVKQVDAALRALKDPRPTEKQRRCTP